LARRLFAGLALDEAARAACAGAIASLQRAGFAAAYEDPAKLHVTLAFLGNVEADRVPAIERVVLATAARTAPFAVTIDKLGAFPHERRPRVIYVGAREQGAAFRRLCGSLRSAYRELGFSFEDDPVAHVTIARVKGRSLRPLPYVELPPVSLPVGELVLFESLFDKAKNTSRYETLLRAPLSAA
jgi:2'-5' RNA ligase